MWKNTKIAKLVLKNLLILIHPFLPFLSDHLYQAVFKQELLETQFNLKSLGKDSMIDQAIKIINLIRKIRNDFNLSHHKILEYSIEQCDENSDLVHLINQVANCKWKSNQGLHITSDQHLININLSKQLISQIKLKTQSEIKQLESEIKRSEAILNNENFINKAPAHLVQSEQEKYQSYQKQLKQLKDSISMQKDKILKKCAKLSKIN